MWIGTQTHSKTQTQNSLASLIMIHLQLIQLLYNSGANSLFGVLAELRPFVR